MILDKGLIFFMNVQLNVYICALRKNSVPFLPEGTIKHKCTIANSQRTLTKTNKNGVIAKVRILVEQVILDGFKDI